MISIDLKARMKNKAFWVAIVSALVLLAQQLGLNIVPKNYSDIVNTVLTILTMLGVVVDTSTPGVSDQISDSTSGSESEASNPTENKTIK
jgi:phi LC3 family holin